MKQYVFLLPDIISEGFDFECLDQQEDQVNSKGTMCIYIYTHTHELNNHKGIIMDMWFHYNSSKIYPVMLV